MSSFLCILKCNLIYHLYRTVDEIEAIFSPLIFYTFLQGGIALCFLAYVAVKVGGITILFNILEYNYNCDIYYVQLWLLLWYYYITCKYYKCHIYHWFFRYIRVLLPAIRLRTLRYYSHFPLPNVGIMPTKGFYLLLSPLQWSWIRARISDVKSLICDGLRLHIVVTP